MDAITGAAQSPAAVSGLWAAAPARASEASGPDAPAKPAPVMDEYVPGEEHIPSGLYWVGKDEDGAPKIYFDDPEAKPASKDKAERCTTNTDKVDRELERLRRRAEELVRQLDAETDPARARELERKQARAEAELAQKDNDSYRRQNAVIS